MQKVSLKGEVQDLGGLGRVMPGQTLQELWVMKIIGASGGNGKISQVVTLQSVLGLGSGVWGFGAV